MAAAIDTLTSRNNTSISIKLGTQIVGRVQNFRASQANNVQVIAELGSDYMVEMSKGLTVFNFSISSFYVRNDVMDPLRSGAPFALVLTDGGPAGGEVLENFSKCMLQSLDRTYSAGAVTVGQDASVVTIGKGTRATVTAI